MLDNSIDFSGHKILVFGDIMLDQYWQGKTARISPEAPVPVVKVEEIEDRAGGAGNVAVNLTSLGCSVKLFGITGHDKSASTLERLFNQHRIDFLLQKEQNIPTITKLRVLSRAQQLIRLDMEQSFAKIDAYKLVEAYKQALDDADAVVISDYSKGTVQDLQTLIMAARERNVPVIIDPKRKDFREYQHASVITPNLSEFEAVVGSCETIKDIEVKGFTLLEELKLEALIVTRGSEGMTVIAKNKIIKHLPARSGEVFDVTGAGDTVVATLAACLASKQDIFQAARLSTIAAAIVVSKVGTSTVTLKEIHQASFGRNLPTGVMGAEQLAAVIQQAKSCGERVVMVNGCYDVIHHGHIRYLERAKAFGDRLVVAVNSDDSIRRLKGPTRPVTTLEHRMEVLAGLQVVDWVVSFSEDKPGRLVEMLLPDILVKTDEKFSTVDDIPEGEGVECVLAQGGIVKLLSRTPNCSSTDIINHQSHQAEATIS